MSCELVSCCSLGRGVAACALVIGLGLALIGCGESQPPNTETVDSLNHAEAESNQPTAIQRSSSVDPASDPFIHATPLTPRSTSGTPTLLERLDPHTTGITDEQVIDTSHPLKRLYVTTHACGGVAVGDLNGDDRTDVYHVNNSGANRLYLQTGNFEFTDATNTAGVGGGDAWGCGAALVDIDGDKDLDIYVCNYESPNQLFINNGENPPTFTEQAKAFGLGITDACVMPYFCDYDRDGDLDVYVVCYRLVYATGVPDEEIYTVQNGQIHVKPQYERYYVAIRLKGKNVYVTECGREDYLFRNEGPDVEGDITFTDVTKQAGIDGGLMGISAAWWDYNEDGYPDLYVANDFEHADRLYRNRGDGTFENEIRYVVPHSAYSAMGSSIADVDDNGHLDLFVLDMASTTHFKEKINMGEMGGVQQYVMDYSQPRQIMRNALYLNTGMGRMTEGALLAGLAKSDWSWSPLMEDFDNDGKTDVVITNGMSRNLTDSDVRKNLNRPGRTEWDYFETLEPYREQNMALRNEGDLKFANVSNDWGFDRETMSFAAATADFDRDGDLDMIIANLDDPPSVLRNNADGNRLVVQLQSGEGNVFGIGAQIEIETNAGKQLRLLAPMRGYAATSEAIAHFGLGDETVVNRLTVTWPDGGQQVHQNIAANQRLVITRNTAAKALVKSKPPPSYLTQRLYGLKRHEDPRYDDFAHQPLLPNRYSQLGPGMAWGDVNKDGRLDLFIGGAAGQPGTLYRRTATESFNAVQKPFTAAREAEDMGAVFLDADRDGDQDLYVASGSYEFSPDDPLLQDRLYVNNAGRFTLAPDALPSMQSAASVVSAADVDRDGDLDLFVGGRVVPREYPVVPLSVLLINESSPGRPRFVDRTAELAPDLVRTGLVTSAVWSDANQDGWVDLVVTHEWGSVKLFTNSRGKLSDQTESSGLSQYKGWWNGIAARDLDNDGDIDYVATNFGLNTKYRASHKKPVYVYFGDYGGEGRMNIVEAKVSDTGLLPVRGKSCSSNAMPHLKDRFTTFRDFASASLAEIYTEKCLEESLRHESNTLETGVFWNRSERGKTQFEFAPLPRLAQISPGFGVVATEMNGDTNPDIYLVHNFYTPQRETGRMDGGLSTMLVGRGNESFEVVPTEASGLLLPGDAKALTIVDLNDDNQPDFVASRNNDFPKAFVSAQAGSRWLRLMLRDGVGNPWAVGAVVTVQSSDGARQTGEVSSGASYLSQSAPYLFFGVSGSVDHIEVRWPDGTTTRHAAQPEWQNGGKCVISWKSAS